MVGGGVAFLFLLHPATNGNPGADTSAKSPAQMGPSRLENLQGKITTLRGRSCATEGGATQAGTPHRPVQCSQRGGSKLGGAAPLPAEPEVVARTLRVLGWSCQVVSPQVLDYAGLVPWVRESAGHQRRGGITPPGSPHLRWILTEAAIRAVQTAPAAPRYFERLARSKPRNVARVALARNLLGAVHALLRDGVCFDEEVFAAVSRDTPPARLRVCLTALLRLLA